MPLDEMQSETETEPTLPPQMRNTDLQARLQGVDLATEATYVARVLKPREE